MKVYNLGSLNIDYVYSVDHFVRLGETLSSENLEIFPGGKGLNQSIALARAGADVIHGAVIGNDGEFLVKTLADSGVNTNRIEISQNSTGHAVIQVNKSGQNCILLFAGTNYCITKEYVENFLADAQENDILLLQNEINGLDMIFDIAYKKKMQIAFNPSPFNKKILQPPLSYVKWWFCNEIEAESLFGSNDAKEIIEEFVKRYPESNLILTLGKNGSIFKNREDSIYQPIYEAKVVDTTAAGDTFTGYFIASIIKGEPVSEALNKASKAASIAVSRNGASVSIPYFNEIAF